MNGSSKLLSGLVLVMGVGACNALVGVEDVSLRNDGSTGAVGGGGSGSGGAQGGSQTTGGKANGQGGSEAGSGGKSSSGGAGGAAGKAGAGGAPGEAGAGAGGTPGEAGAGGEGGGPVDPPCPLPHETVGGGELSLVQFMPHEGGRGRLVVSKNGEHAYATTWGEVTRHFTRDPATGRLTFASSAGIYNGESVALSPDDRHLYAFGTSSAQFYDLAIAADGTISSEDDPEPPGFTNAIDALAFGDSAIFLASDSSIRAIVGGVYDATNRAPGTYEGVRTLSRGGDYLYWNEYAVTPWYPGQTPKMNRARVNCDGSLEPREVLDTTFSPVSIAVCPETELAYVIHSSENPTTNPGYLDVIDLSECESDFSTCTPADTFSSADIPGLTDPSGIAIAPDCSTLYVTDGFDAAGRVLTLSLEAPMAPALAQTFTTGVDYDGVTLSGNMSGWHMTFFDGYLYIPFEFGEGIAVFKAGP